MKELHFYGYSDDTFMCETYDEKLNRKDYVHDDGAGGTLMAFQITSGEEGLIVTGQYAPKPMHSGTWVIGITLLEEDMSLPNWPMKYMTDDSFYSPRLIIEAPNDVVIEDISKRSRQ